MHHILLFSGIDTAFAMDKAADNCNKLTIWTLQGHLIPKCIMKCIMKLIIKDCCDIN